MKHFLVTVKAYAHVFVTCDCIEEALEAAEELDLGDMCHEDSEPKELKGSEYEISREKAHATKVYTVKTEDIKEEK